MPVWWTQSGGPGGTPPEINPGLLVTHQYDEFIAPESGNFGARVGQLQWGTTASGGSVNNYEIVGELDHDGIFGLRTPAALNATARIHRGSIGTTVFTVAPQVGFADFLIRVPDVTSCIVRAGIGRDISSPTFGTHGAWIEYNSGAHANWRAVTREAGVSAAPADTTIAATGGAWVMLSSRRTAGGDWEFYVNETLRATLTTNQPTGIVTVGIYVETLVAATREVHVDWHEYMSATKGARF